MFKTFAWVDLFVRLHNQSFIKRYENHISGPPLDMAILAISILFLWLTRGGVLDYIAPHLRYFLVILPKYHYELPWVRHVVVLRHAAPDRGALIEFVVIIFRYCLILRRHKYPR